MRAWDILFFVFVLAPALTGGVWLRREGFHVEYSQPGVAVLVLALWLWWARQKGWDAARESYFCRIGLAAWAWWRRLLDEKPARTLGCAWLFVSLTLFLTSVIRHRGFGSGLADMSIFTNGIWNVASEGYPYSSIKDGLSLLADHQIFLLYPLGWIYRIWPSPEFLLLIQSLALSSGAVALFLLARQRVGKGNALAAFLPIAYWLGSPIRNVNRFDFHPEVLMLPLFLFAALFLQENSFRKRGAGFFLLLCALAAKESAGPVACGIGLAWMLGAGPEGTRRFTRHLGAWVAVMGFVAFYVDSQIVPKMFGRAYAYGELYAPFGSSPAKLLAAPFTQPVEFFSRLFTLSRVKYFLGSVLPYAGLPFMGPFAPLSSLPGYLMLFLTNGNHRISLSYHYVIEPMTGFLFAAPAALATHFVRGHSGAILVAMVLGTSLSFGRSEAYFWRVYQIDNHKAYVRDEILPRVPVERIVSASYGLTPHLSSRRWIHQLPKLLDEKGGLVECALWERTVNNSPMGIIDESRLAAELKIREYERELSCGSLAVYRRSDVPSCLSEAPPPCVETP